MDWISSVLTFPASSMALRATSMTWLMSPTSLTAWAMAVVAFMSRRRIPCSRVICWYWPSIADVGVSCMALAKNAGSSSRFVSASEVARAEPVDTRSTARPLAHMRCMSSNAAALRGLAKSSGVRVMSSRALPPVMRIEPMTESSASSVPVVSSFIRMVLPDSRDQFALMSAWIVV